MKSNVSRKMQIRLIYLNVERLLWFLDQYITVTESTSANQVQWEALILSFLRTSRKINFQKTT
jgi:hypothetical protein